MCKKIPPQLILAIVPLLALAPLWIHAHAMSFDTADYFLPQRYFLSECLRHGIFPWWNPYSDLGIPFHADPQSGAFYPIAWMISLLFGYDFYTINCEYLLHIMIAGWGMYNLMFSIIKSVYVSLCIAIAYQLCGVFIGNAQHLTWIISAAWLPWVIFYWKNFFGRKVSFGENRTVRDAISTALCLMMMTTGGYPAFLIILMYGVAIWSIVFMVKKLRNNEMQSLKRFLRLQLSLLSCYAAITAPYIVSLIKALPYFTRGAMLKTNPILTSAFAPQSIISFLFPTTATLNNTSFFSDMSMNNYYIGLLPLIFLITLINTRQSRTVWVLFIISCLLLLISFGHSFYIWNILFNYVPLINYIRFAASFRIFALMGFLITAGIVMRNPHSHKKAIHASIFLLAIISSTALLSYYTEGRITFPKTLSEQDLKSLYYKSSIFNDMLLQSFIQVSLLIAFILILSRRILWLQPHLGYILLIIVCFDMLIATQINSRITVFGTHNVHLLNDKLRQQPKGFPIPDQNNLMNIAHEGDGSFSPSFYNNNLFKKQFALNSYNPFHLNNKDSLDNFPRQMELLAHPLVFISDQLQNYPSNYRDTSFRLIKNSVLISKKTSIKFEQSNLNTIWSEISITQFDPNKISLSTKSSHQAVVTLLQNYYPGWKATIDNVSAQIQISNYSTISLELPKGSHHITFEYDPGIIRWMLWLAIASQIILLIFLFTSYRKFKSSKSLGTIKEKRLMF